MKLKLISSMEKYKLFKICKFSLKIKRPGESAPGPVVT